MVKTHVWEVSIVQSATIVVTGPTSVNFSNIPWSPSGGTSCGVETDFIITNTSTTQAAIVTSTIGGTNANQFTCTMTPSGACGVAQTIPALGIRTVHTNFCPTSAGVKTGNLTISCPGCGTSGYTFTSTFTGTGINTTLGVINASGSIYDSGPYVAGTSQNIASVSIRNDGNTAGTLQYRCYIYANEAGQALLLEGSTTNDYNPGASVQQPMVVTIPANTPSGSVTFGVMVKGETETTWPAWGALGTMIWTEGLDIDTGMIIGGVAAASIIGGLLYIAFKKR